MSKIDDIDIFFKLSFDIYWVGSVFDKHYLKTDI